MHGQVMSIFERLRKDYLFVKVIARALLRILVTSPDRETELRGVLGTARCEPAPAN